MKNKRLYNIWSCMKQRCYNPNHTATTWYYFKGIRICEEWLKYENFETWAMANGYTDELSIDRIDSDKDYEPSNCQWITLEENRKRAHRKPRQLKRVNTHRKGKFMVVQQSRHFWSPFVKVVEIGFTKSDALKFIRELESKDYEHHYYDRVTDGHKVGEIVMWSNLRRCLKHNKSK